MNTQLVEIQPRELKFIFEVNKQSSSVVHLANVTDQYVAFKVKTTSPKKYCVRPNVGIIKPKSAYDFTVTMQAQKLAPSDMHFKDKFLIQGTVVPFGTTEEEITPGMFAKDSNKYIEETKLRVVLISPPSSPAKLLADVALKQDVSFETLKPKEPLTPALLPVNGYVNLEPSYEISMPKENSISGFEKPIPPDPLTNQVEALQNVKIMEDSRSLNDVDNKPSVPSKVEDFFLNRDDKPMQTNDFEDDKLKLMKDIEDLRSKISCMDSKLIEAQHTIEKLREEKSSAIREKEILKQDLATRTRSVTRKIQIGFPPLFVCTVALISLVMGSLFRG